MTCHHFPVRYFIIHTGMLLWLGLSVCLSVVGSVCLSVCVSVIQNLTYRPTNDTTYLTGNEGQNICGIFSETAAFVSYGVKQKLKSRYANERWAYLDQIPTPFHAGGVSEVTCRIRAMSKKLPTSCWCARMG